MVKGTTSLKARAERFCARLNDGLTAVAFVLAMLVFVVGAYRTLESLADSPQPGWDYVADSSHPS
jgi:hypothetical protein